MSDLLSKEGSIRSIVALIIENPWKTSLSALAAIFTIAFYCLWPDRH